MRKEYSKILREVFPKQMGECLPKFEQYKNKSMYIFPGERVFSCKVSEQVLLFVICSPDAKGHDRFTIELGWSKLNRFPELSMRPSFSPSEDRAEFNQDEAATRLPYLYNGEEFWNIGKPVDPFNFSTSDFTEQQKKLSNEEAKEKVLPVLDNAFNMLKTAGVDYLNEYLKSQDIGESL